MKLRLESVWKRPSLWRLTDGERNTYIVRDGAEALLIDPGIAAGRKLPEPLGKVRPVRALLTLPSLRLLTAAAAGGVPALTSSAAAPYLTETVRAARRGEKIRRAGDGFCDGPCDVPGELVCSLGEGVVFRWGRMSFHFLALPGDTDANMAILLATPGGFLAFPGEGAAAGGTYWHPHRLEWDHWTGLGARAAARGLERLGNLPIRGLFPPHGEPVLRQVRRSIGLTRERVESWASVKEAFVPGVAVGDWPGEEVSAGIRRLASGVYHLGLSAYLVAGNSGRGCLIDAVPSQEEAVRTIMRIAGVETIAFATATHYHFDHADGLDVWRKTFGARIVLGASVAGIVARKRASALPFLGEPLNMADRRMRDRETLRSDGLHLQWHRLPGQTRYHDGILLGIPSDGLRVFFTGDNFFVPQCYNGTGGCSVANHSRPEHYAASARRVLAAEPHLIAGGHGSWFAFSPKYFQQVIRWAAAYRRALEVLRHPLDRAGYFLPGEPRAFAEHV